MTNTNISHLTLGVCDYPEHVPQNEWQKHAVAQKQLGLTYVRLAEFAWSKIEPSQGHYDWDWLDQAIDVYAALGLKIVLGTPTATPPAWLIAKYPDVLPIDENGLVKKFGSRRHYDHASEIYRELCAGIVELMARRYAEHPAVVGWQIDNELGHEGTTVSYGGASAARFPDWLAAKYDTLDNLNIAWGNAFWSQNYSDWKQIGTPNLTAVRQANPSHALDYQRFCSDMIEEFQQGQIALLRKICPDHFITHNYVIFSAESDLYKLAKNLDFVAWDSYPIGMLEFFATWESEEIKTRYARTGHPDLVSLNHDIYRGLKQGEGFWVMEQQCGHANWAQYNPLPATGAVKLWSAQAWAHGADSIIYFRFRASHMAQEIMHSGLLHQSGKPDRGYAEVESFDPCQFATQATKNRVAMVHSYDSLWSYNQQPHNQDLSYWHQFALFYGVARSLGLDVDIVHPLDIQDSQYDFVICPALTLLNPDEAQVLIEHSKANQLIFGPRTDFRDQYGKAALNGQFSMLSEIIGGQPINFDSLRPTLKQQVVDRNGNVSHEAELWCESYSTKSENTLFSYQQGPLDGQAAVVSCGSVITIGALSKTLIEQVISQSCSKQGIECEKLPEGIRRTIRGDSTLWVNFNNEDVAWNGMLIPAVGYLLSNN